MSFEAKRRPMHLINLINNERDLAKSVVIKGKQ